MERADPRASCLMAFSCQTETLAGDHIKIFLFRTPLRSRMLSKLLALVPFRSLHEYPAIDYNVAADPESGMMMEDGM